jgi:hypothetical protein
MLRITLLLVFLLAGCVPLLTVTQPEVEILVTDEDGVPIEGALLNFASQLYGPNGSTKFASVRTDQSGIVRLARESYIQLALLVVDGIAVYGWSYCIEKAGFQPAVRNHLEKNTSASLQWRFHWQDRIRSVNAPGMRTGEATFIR